MIISPIWLVFIASLFFPSNSNSGSTDKLNVGDFSHRDLTGWTEKSFVSQTDYTLHINDTVSVLKGHANKSASIFYKAIKIDLQKTPWMHWSWKVSNTYGDINEQEKSGDDYPARVYIVIKTGIFPWNTRALNYVWASSSPKEKIWDNAYTKHAKMIAMQSGTQFVGQWKTETRNIREDIRNILGREIDIIDGIAIMVDADDSQLEATGYFSDIYFTHEKNPEK